MIIDYGFWGRFIFWGKVAAGALAFGTAIGIVHRSVTSPIFRRVVTINDMVTVLSTNHLPHIQKSLNNQDVVLSALKTDVAKANTKIEEFGSGLSETKETVSMLNSSLMTHLQNVQEPALRKKRNARSK